MPSLTLNDVCDGLSLKQFDNRVEVHCPTSDPDRTSRVFTIEGCQTAKARWDRPTNTIVLACANGTTTGFRPAK